MRAVAVSATAALLGLLSAPSFACPSSEQGFRRLSTADAEVAYRWDPIDLRVGQFFSAEIVACRAEGAEPVREIKIDVTMPAHGHGMNYRPASHLIAPGHYKFTGLMLHMPGSWRIAVDLLGGAKRIRLTHEVSLKP